MRGCLVALLLAGCLPQVGPPVDGGAGGGASGSGGGGAVGGGGGSASGGGGASNNDGGPSCTDMMHDGDETDVDCGGSCSPCGLAFHCAGPADCVSGVCTGNQCVMQDDACAPAFATCTTFADLTAPGANRTITFGGGQDIYTPKCIAVKLGQSVTFNGNFSNHPMAQACGPLLGTLAQTNGNTATFTFDSALGVFGFYCTMHGAKVGTGMAGAIEVVR